MKRDIPFPMKDPYSPVDRALVPVPGYNEWPPHEVLSRAYYGLDAEETQANAIDAAPGKAVAFNAEPVVIVGGTSESDEVMGFSGFADNEFGGGFGFVPFPSVPQTDGGEDSGDTSGGGIDWGSIINAGIHSAPAIIQAAEGGGAPFNFYQQAGSLLGAAPAGYTRNAQGQLIPLQSAANLAGGLGVGVAQIGNSFSNFITQNPLLVLGGGFALLLLFMRPPGRR
jgi:hypothetical protein